MSGCVNSQGVSRRELRNLGAALSRIAVQIRRKIRGLGCVNQARTRARVTQPSPHIFLRICTCLLRWLGQRGGERRSMLRCSERANKEKCCNKGIKSVAAAAVAETDRCRRCSPPRRWTPRRSHAARSPARACLWRGDCGPAPPVAGDCVDHGDNNSLSALSPFSPEQKIVIGLMS